MLRTNHSFLSFIENLYAKNKGDHPDLKLKSMGSGMQLLTQGEPAAEVWMVKKGITKCFFSEENGKDYIAEFLGEGEILGEIEAIRNTVCLCHIQTITDVEAYALSIPFFKHLFSSDITFNQLLLEEMAERVVNTASRSSAQQLYSMEHGLKRILAFQNRRNLNISKEDMAAYLGITVRSLNRALKQIGGNGQDL